MTSTYDVKLLSLTSTYDMLNEGAAHRGPGPLAPDLPADAGRSSGG